MSDEERIDFLEDRPGCNLISDDQGRWAVSTFGWQPVVIGEHEETFVTTSLIEPDEWRPSIREALDAFIEEMGDDA